MNTGEALPTTTFETTNGKASFADFKGKWLVIYFYPKDATPGCTKEGCDFRDNYTRFSALNALVFGVSRDSLASHTKFKTKEQFPFELISDVDETLCHAFDVIKMKSMYGKQVRGIERSTFIINPEGLVAYAWSKVSVTGHVDSVYEELSKLQQSL